jgi:SAM-dependent methyltransferase
MVAVMRGGWEQWQWDETLFAGAAEYYDRGRLPYAERLADALGEALALDGGGRLLDVGCGPGTIALRLAHLFESVVGLDPDAGMIAEAERLARERNVTNTRWVRRRAEELPADLGAFRVVTFAASFHWMDRPKVAAAVATMLERDGAAVQVDAPGYRPEELAAASAAGHLPHPPPPDEAIEELRSQWLGDDRRAGQSIRNTSPAGEDDVFQSAGFLPMHTVRVPDGRVINRTIDDIVAQRLSSSSTAPHLFGDDLPAFVQQLRALLADASPSGVFSVRLPDNELRLWRLP